MKSNSKFFFIILPIIAVVVVLLNYYPFRSIPDGLPNDYFSQMDILYDNDVDMYVYSDAIDFNGDYNYIKVFGLNDLSRPNPSHFNVLVIDMNKNIEMEIATEDQIKILYESYAYTLIFVNYKTSGSFQYSTFIDQMDIESDMIVFSYDAGGNKYSGSNSSGFPSKQMLMYAIIDEISHIILENEYDSQATD